MLESCPELERAEVMEKLSANDHQILKQMANHCLYYSRI